MTKLAVCINWPYSQIPWTFFSSLWNSDIRFEKDVVLMRAVSPDPALSENMLWKAALEIGAEEIYHCDVDQGVPPKVLERLRAHNKDIVGGITARRNWPNQWCMYEFGPGGHNIFIDPDKPLQKVDCLGGGCTLLKTKILRDIPEPWHKTTISEDGTSIVQSGEFYFFRKAKEAGFEVYIDTTLESPHYTEMTLNAASLGRKLPHMEVLVTNVHS